MTQAGQTQECLQKQQRPSVTLEDFVLSEKTPSLSLLPPPNQARLLESQCVLLTLSLEIQVILQPWRSRVEVNEST